MRLLLTTFDRRLRRLRAANPDWPLKHYYSAVYRRHYGAHVIIQRLHRNTVLSPERILRGLWVLQNEKKHIRYHQHTAARRAEPYFIALAFASNVPTRV